MKEETKIYVKIFVFLFGCAGGILLLLALLQKTIGGYAF